MSPSPKVVIFWCQACCFVHQEVIKTSAIFEDRLRREARSCKESILYLAKAHGPRSAYRMIHEIQVLQLSKALKMPHRLFAVPHLCHEEKSWQSIRISRATDLGDGWIFGENQSISVYARRDRYLWLTCWGFLCGTVGVDTCLMFAIEKHKHKAQLMIGIPTTDFHCFWQELNFFAWFVANFPASEGPFSPCASIRPKCRVQRLWQSRASNKLALYRVFTRRLLRHSAPFSWRSKMPVTSQDFSLNLETKPLRFTRPNDTLYYIILLMYCNFIITIQCSMYVADDPGDHLDPSLAHPIASDRFDAWRAVLGMACDQEILNAVTELEQLETCQALSSLSI